MVGKVILITGASSGFGSIAARLLAHRGNIVYAGMRQHETEAIAAAKDYARKNSIHLRIVFLDITDDHAVGAAVQKVIDENGQIDVLVQNAAHGSMGPAEAFSEQELMNYFDINVIGAHRLNRAVLPYMRRAGQGLIMWTSSSSVKGGAPPFCGPYFATKAAMESLAVSYAGELTRWGIETSLIIPGAYPKGTNHFATMSRPANEAIGAEYFDGPYKGVIEQIVTGITALFPPESEASEVAQAMVRVVEMPHGSRPLRTHVDPSQDGCEVVNGVHDRVRKELLRRIGLEDLLTPAKTGVLETNSKLNQINRPAK